MLSINPEKTITFEEQTWRVRIPTPNVERLIDVEVSKRLQGMPVESIPIDTRNYTKMCVTLNTVVIQRPVEFESLRDFEAYHDQDFVVSLYMAYSEKYQEFQNELLEKKRPTPKQTFDDRSTGTVSSPQIQNTTSESGNNGRPISGADRVSNENGNDARGFSGSVQSNPSVGKTRQAGKVVSTG